MFIQPLWARRKPSLVIQEKVKKRKVEFSESRDLHLEGWEREKRLKDRTVLGCKRMFIFHHFK